MIPVGCMRGAFAGTDSIAGPSLLDAGVRPAGDAARVSRENLLLVAVALGGALIALVIARWLRAWRGSWRAQRRAGRAVAGEEDAAVMLRRAGFRIVARQARTWWAPLVDGEPHELELRADYLVEAKGELLVAEVKTGEEAPQLATAATRRQLLEYHVAFEVDGVLLVCPELGAIHRVEFPIGRPSGAAAVAASPGRRT